MPDIIRLMDAGMSMARFNMSHGNPKVSKSFLLCKHQILVIRLLLIAVTNLLTNSCVLHDLQDNARLIRKFFEARKLRPFKTCALTLDLRGREIRACPRTEPAEGVKFEMGETTRVRSDEFHSGKSTHDCI